MKLKKKLLRRTMKEDFRRSNMKTGVAFKFLRIVVEKKARNRKRVPRARSAIEEIIIIGITVRSCKMMRSSTGRKFVKLMYQSGKFIIKIIKKTFIEKVLGSYDTVVGK